MNRIIRLVGLAFLLLVVFLAALVFLAAWLRRQNERLRVDTIHSRTNQLTRILELAPPPPPPWPESFTARLGAALDARIQLIPAAPARSGPAPLLWEFEYTIPAPPGGAETLAHVALEPPPSVRTLAVVHNLGVALLALALLAMLTLLFLLIVDRRWLRLYEPATGEAPVGSLENLGMLSQLAARSARQSEELEVVREERQRAEADAHLKQILLNRALQEKVDMGRDLHDGLIQSLYATGLTIQAGRKALDQDPATARQQIDTALQTLNAAIREVRTYIAGLGPEQLQQRSLADSVRAIVDSLSAVREVAAEIRIDEDAAHQLSSEQTTDLLQIIRESVSNALRHGHARQIAVRLHRNAHELCLLVHDNGRGFDPRLAPRGHGLDNIQARANRLAARLSCQSEPGQGTRIVLTFTVPSAPPRS